MRTKEADLLAAGLLYVARCIIEGDTHALRHLGLGQPTIQAFSQLSVNDLLRLTQGQPRGHCLEIRFNAAAFQRKLDYVHTLRHTEDTLTALLQGDAPRAMLTALFGLSGNDYHRRRQLLGLSAAVGRPAEPDDATRHTVWTAWRQVVGDRPTEAVTPEHYLAIHQATGVSLRVIWNLAQQWQNSAEEVNIKFVLKSVEWRSDDDVTAERS